MALLSLTGASKRCTHASKLPPLGVGVGLGLGLGLGLASWLGLGLGALVLHGLDHHLGLVLRLLHSEHPRVADGVVRHDARPRDLLVRIRVRGRIRVQVRVRVRVRVRSPRDLHALVDDDQLTLTLTVTLTLTPNHALVDDDHHAAAAGGEQARELAEYGRLAHVRLADKEQAFLRPVRELGLGLIIRVNYG